MNLNPKIWVNYLQDVVNSRSIDSLNKGKGRLFIIYQDHQFKTQSYNKLNPQYKLSIDQIVDTSLAQFEKLKEEFTNSKIEDHEFEELTQQLSHYTEQLVDFRTLKRNQSTRRYLLIGIVKFISRFFGFFKITIPLFHKLIQSQQESTSKDIQLKAKIKQPTEDALKKLEKLKQTSQDAKDSLGKSFYQLEVQEKIESEKENIKREVQSKIDRVPEVISDLRKMVSDQNNLQMLQKQFIKDFQDVGSESLFDKDMKRGIAFLRKDDFLKIDDEHPEPSYDLLDEERVKKGEALLKELLLKEDDPRWEKSIKLLATQTSLNILLGSIILVLNANLFSEIWTDPENNKMFALTACFSDRLPPVNIEIIRHHQTQQIEKININVKGYLDIMKYFTEEMGKKEMIMPKAVVAELSYSIALGDHYPIVDNLNSSIEVITKTL